MALPLSKRWALGVRKPWPSTPGQHQSKRWAVVLLKPLPRIQHRMQLSKRWKRLTVVSPNKPIVKFRRIHRKQPLVELIDYQVELMKTALDNGD